MNWPIYIGSILDSTIQRDTGVVQVVTLPVIVEKNRHKVYDLWKNMDSYSEKYSIKKIRIEGEIKNECNCVNRLMIIKSQTL